MQAVDRINDRLVWGVWSGLRAQRSPDKRIHRNRLSPRLQWRARQVVSGRRFGRFGDPELNTLIARCVCRGR